MRVDGRIQAIGRHFLPLVTRVTNINHNVSSEREIEGSQIS